MVAEERDVGAVTSATWSPALGQVVALGYVHRRVTVPAAVTVRAEGAGAGGDVIEAEARALPLV